jgi:hypothetical protein
MQNKIIVICYFIMLSLSGYSQHNSIVDTESKVFLNYLFDSIYHEHKTLINKEEKKKVYLINRSTIPFSFKRLPQEIFDKENNRIDTMGMTSQKNIVLDLYKIIEQKENIIFSSMIPDKLSYKPEIMLVFDKIWISQPIFLEKMSYCLIEIGSKSQGKIHLFKKENQKWSLSSTISEWIFHAIE